MLSIKNKLKARIECFVDWIKLKKEKKTRQKIWLGLPCHVNM